MNKVKLLLAVLPCLLCYTAQLSAYQGETWIDPNLRRTWQQADNGYKVNWLEAQDYCASLGSGWALPSMRELASLYGGGETRCGTVICNVSPQLKLTGGWFWTRDTDGSRKAWMMSLHNGAEFSTEVHLSPNGRALCVQLFEGRY